MGKKGFENGHALVGEEIRCGGLRDLLISSTVQSC